MSVNSVSVTAAEVMDRCAVLMNDPAKTDYTYVTLIPFVKIALDDLGQALLENQSAPMVSSWSKIVVPKGHSIVYPHNMAPPEIPNAPTYPINLIEIQEIKERIAGQDVSSGPSFILMTRVEFVPYHPPMDRLEHWLWENQTIKFNAWGATTDRELLLRYLGEFVAVDAITPDSIVGGVNARQYLAYKTAAYAAMFIGENPERATVLDSKAEESLERMLSISNKGRQQIMTRHRPFRAAWKMRGGF